ncbi:MAG: transaldolase [Gammaproteobacteria bacterium]|nr:MAG: transaldolase [Gammaproteobacteria bacterium]
MANKLEQLKTMTTVVADTGDIDSIRKFKPQDATTNPSLLLQAAQLEVYRPLLQESITWADSTTASPDQKYADAMDYLSVKVGTEITSVIPGYISTEVDARLSFDTQATLQKARRLIQLYEQNGIGRDRVLIKIAATWEGIQAAKILEIENIHCNLTLIFGFAQAVACAEAQVTLISPFVGRILDWHRASTGQDYTPENDPGVISVKEIYSYFKAHQYSTIIMGASFRNTGEIEQLAGCDRLTISPGLMAELQQDSSPLKRQLDPKSAQSDHAKIDVTEKYFRWQMNQSAMATEKLADGIRRFTEDQIKLETLLRQL